MYSGYNQIKFINFPGGGNPGRKDMVKVTFVIQKKKYQLSNGCSDKSGKENHKYDVNYFHTPILPFSVIPVNFLKKRGFDKYKH